MHPRERREGILDRRGKFVLGAHAVIDRGDQRLGAGAQIARDEIMRVEAADHMAAAVVVDDCRHRAAGTRPIEAEAKRAARAGHRPLLDPRDRQRLGPAGARRRLHLLARLGRGHRLDRPQLGRGRDPEDFLDLRMQARHGLSP
jgi:hypothetical protein